MWKPEHRATADRRGLRYESDLTDAEWALVAPLIRPAKRGGRPRTVNVREVLNAIFYVLWTGCQWKALPKDLPPRSTVWEYLDLWDWDGTLERIHHALYVEVRENAGREASPTTAIIDSQTAKGAVKGGASLDASGYDAGKKVLGRKRHVLTDTIGLLLAVHVHPASVQDRDGAEALLREARRSFPFIERIIGDAGYQGQKMQAAVARTARTSARGPAPATRTRPSRGPSSARVSGARSAASRSSSRRSLAGRARGHRRSVLAWRAARTPPLACPYLSSLLSPALFGLPRDVIGHCWHVSQAKVLLYHCFLGHCWTSLAHRPSAADIEIIGVFTARCGPIPGVLTEPGPHCLR